MPRKLTFCVLASLSLAASSALAAPPPSPTQPTASSTEAKPAQAGNAGGPVSAPKGINNFVELDAVPEESREQFQAFVAEGDRARLSFRIADAIRAYRGALDLYHDPLIAGRFGVVVLMLNDRTYDYVAAGHLNDAVSHAAGANQAERDLFWQAYKEVRRRVCEVVVLANDINAVIYTGELRRPAKGVSSFITYVNAGPTQFRATLAGYPDIEKTLECVGGKKGYVELMFDKPEPKAVDTSPEAPKTILVHDEIVPTPAPPAAPLPISPVPGSSIALLGGIGPLMVLGAAPSPLFGARLDLWFRRGMGAAMVSARGAWTVGSVDLVPMTTSAFGLVAGPCARWQWVDACALGAAHVFFDNVPLNSLFRTANVEHLFLGFGIALGGEYQLSPKVGLRLSGDVVALARDRVIRVEDSERVFPLWQGGRFLSTISATLVFSP